MTAKKNFRSEKNFFAISELKGSISILSQALKTNENLEFAVITGCLTAQNCKKDRHICGVSFFQQVI